MNYEFCTIMSSDEVVLLCFVIHHQEVCSGDLPPAYRKAGWSWCMTKTMERYLGWDEHKQRRVLRKLKDRGYIECEQHRKRNPKGVSVGQPVRWLRISMAAIVADLDEAILEFNRTLTEHAEW